jgi:Divergent InlB B-repeat domain
MKPIRLAALLTPCLTLALSACGGGGGGSDRATDAQLAVTVAGPTGTMSTGRVTSHPAGIACGSACNATFAIDTVVTLTAAAPAEQQFSAWSGACSGAVATCTVRMSEQRAVTATFAAASDGTAYPLSVVVSGNGTVTSQPSGVDCAGTCLADFAAGTVVTLTAVPASGQAFSSWGGACSGSTAICSLSLGAAQAVTAAFIPAPSTIGWSDEAVVSEGGAGAPRVGIDAAGNATAIWLQVDPGTNRRSVWSSRRPAGTGWSTPVLLEGSDLDFFEAELAVDAASGRVMAVWRGATVQEVYARPADATGAWSAVTRINGAGSNVLDLQVGIDTSGNAVVVWSQTPSASTITSVWSNRYTTANGWSTATQVAVAANSAQDLDPVLSVSATGRAFVVWTRNGSGVMASHAETGSAWSAATVLAAGQVSTGVGSPRVAADANGNAMAVWGQGARNTSNQIVTNLASKRFASGAWSGTLAPLFAPLVSSLITDVRLASNGLGQFAAVWALPDSSIFAAQSDTSGNWSASRKVFDLGQELRSVPEIGIDSSGNMFTSWDARVNSPLGSPSNIWLSRFEPTANWNSPGVHQVARVASGPRLVMNDRGHAVMVWVTTNNSSGSRIISRSFTSGR